MQIHFRFISNVKIAFEHRKHVKKKNVKKNDVVNDYFVFFFVRSGKKLIFACRLRKEAVMNEKCFSLSWGRAFLLTIVCLLMAVCADAQIQQGMVKTRGRMVNGQLQHGQPIAGATVRVKDCSVVVSGGDGRFSVSVRTSSFLLQSVSKQGYQLVDADVLRNHQRSTEPLNIVMEPPEQQRADQLAAERRIRRNLQRQLQEREDEIDALQLSNAEKDSLLALLYSQQEDNERLIHDMAQRFATLDYDQLDEFYRQVSFFIEQGELTRADSLLRSRGDLNAQVEQQLQRGQAIAEQTRQLQQAQAVHTADNEELAQRCYSYYETFKAQHRNDSAAHYLEMRAALDSTNVLWQKQAALFIFDYLADYDKAIQYIGKALRMAVSQHGEMSNEAAAQYVEIGRIYSATGAFTSANEYYDKALGIILASDHCDSTMLNTVYGNIGTNYHRMGQYDKALEYFQKELEIDTCQNITDSLDLASTYGNMGAALAKLNRLDEALEYIKMYVSILEHSAEAEKTSLANAYNSLGGIYGDMKNYELALEYMKKALAIKEEMYGPEHPSVAITCNNIGKAYGFLENYNEADAYFRRALDIRKRFLGMKHPDTMNSYRSLADLCMVKGEYDNAMEHLLVALDIAKEIFGDGHAQVSRVEMELSSSYRMLSRKLFTTGDYAAAETYARQALDICKRLLGPDHQRTESLQSQLNVTQKALLSTDVEAMKEYVYVGTVSAGSAAADQGLEGDYVLLEYNEWTILSTASAYPVILSTQDEPKTLLIMKDNVISQHHFDGPTGIVICLEKVGQEEKQRIVRAYRDTHRDR